MKYFLLLILSCLLLLTETALASNTAGPAETLFFYNAYLIEFKTVSNPKKRKLAKGCPAAQADAPCTYPEFLEHILDVKLKPQVHKPKFQNIINNAGTAGITETSRKLRENGFKCKYDLAALVEGIGKVTPFSKVLEAVEEQIKEKVALSSVESEKNNIKTALKLVEQNRVADNMRWFNEELEKRLGVEFVKSPRTTDDGRVWQAYDTEATGKKYPDYDKLSEKTKEAVKEMRDAKFQVEDKGFAPHQAVVVKVKSILKRVNKC
ncbi:hypothetical protein ANOM_004567 [Aspergillus nomiae NRRL 13137]|uniref:Uncharacterized protein n=1 Tax=Aspergillus nomiae NRRL (strain ATCC 15546 / NRRL 13137 / CBS 260.88 / M93) TaxID=1509407 RepID=A0A0L1J8A7_ASPN3|nr:uncharacterized protein ANOM_004567 [Aspergillus nomiae NRRL 13137]KNG87972.1 hypothetical protein ANOM_004567 [Aspergillus nomiae NRRL 13137]